MHSRLLEITERIRARSRVARARYLAQLAEQVAQGSQRQRLGCTNLAHDYAAASAQDKQRLLQTGGVANIAIVSAYNDLLSAHAPYQEYPQQLKQHLARLGHVGQMAAGVPAMCDGITQGQTGMELSLFSRDVIALSSAVGLSHQVFDGMLLLGICDKIVPGLLMAALRFGHLPALFVPSGPMPSGISNQQKADVRQAFAAGQATEEALLASEMASYHSPGTCTFYGTANSNQMLLEMMGLQLPGSSFVAPTDPLRPLLTAEAARILTQHTALEADFMPIGQMVDERTIVNAVVGLLATGGSTNHTIHLVAIARMAGIHITWQDMSDLSTIVPLLLRVYPNGDKDINAFQASGGMPQLLRELLSLGLVHGDARTLFGQQLSSYTQHPYFVTLANGERELRWHDQASTTIDPTVLASASLPFRAEGGLRRVDGDLGQAIVKVSAIAEPYWSIEAPARVFTEQEQVLHAYQQGELNRDVVIVLHQQGPRANGMPELHQLIPALMNIQQAGYRVALVTDGRLSGASGKVLAAIHVSPESVMGGAIGRIVDGDVIHLDAQTGVLRVLNADLDNRPSASSSAQRSTLGCGRELFHVFRQHVDSADVGAVSIGWIEED